MNGYSNIGIQTCERFTQEANPEHVAQQEQMLDSVLNILSVFTIFLFVSLAKLHIYILKLSMTLD